MLMFRPLARAALAAAAASGLIALSATPAHAWDAVWHHGLQNLSYYMPGPPPGNALAMCAVDTQLTKWPAPDVDKVYLDINPTGTPSACNWGDAQIVLWGVNCPVIPSSRATYPNHEQTVSYGKPGCPILGANFWAWSDFGIGRSWQVTA
jgi:hypothetical protein